MTLEDRCRELAARVDAFFERVKARYPDDLACGLGCTDCCRAGLTLTSLEARLLKVWLDGNADAVAGALAEPGRDLRAGACAALLVDGRCAIYDARPLVCRSHGLPIRFPPDGARRLPVVDACEKNFTARPLDSLEPGAVLDQGTLSTVLGALDAALADQVGAPRGARVDLADLLEGSTRRRGTNPPAPRRT
jgi:hypothetical protein